MAAEFPNWILRLVFSDLLTSAEHEVQADYSIICVEKNESTGSKIVLVKNKGKKALVRLEFCNNALISTMAGNYFLLTVENNGPSKEIEERISTVGELTEGERIWLERCPNMTSLCALHFYPPDRIALFDRLIKSAHELDLKPFPDYVNMGN